MDFGLLEWSLVANALLLTLCLILLAIVICQIRELSRRHHRLESPNSIISSRTAYPNYDKHSYDVQHERRSEISSYLERISPVTLSSYAAKSGQYYPYESATLPPKGSRKQYPPNWRMKPMPLTDSSGGPFIVHGNPQSFSTLNRSEKGVRHNHMMNGNKSFKKEKHCHFDESAKAQKTPMNDLGASRYSRNANFSGPHNIHHHHPSCCQIDKPSSMPALTFR